MIRRERELYDTLAGLIEEVLKEKTPECRKGCVLLALHAKGLAVDIAGEVRKKMEELEEVTV